MVENDTPSPTESAEDAAAGYGAPLDHADPTATPADDSPDSGASGTSAGVTPSDEAPPDETDPEATPADGEPDDPFAGMSEKERAFWEMMSQAKESPRYQACPECDGIAHVRTGSMAGQEFALIPCEGCAGKGYVARQTTGAPNMVAPVSPDPPAPGMQWDPQRGIWAYPGT